MKQKNKIYLVSSSTGGHALPIFYIHEELKTDFDLKILNSNSPIEREIFKQCHTVTIIAGKIKRYNYIASIPEVLKSAVGFLQAFLIMLFSRPSLIISKGGFCAVPVLTAAKLLGIPYLAHESDSVMGISNKLFAKNAKRMFTGFPEIMYKDLALLNLEYAGQIVKVQKSNQTTKKPLIYITGGSQGAKPINNVVFDVLPKLLDRFAVCHQTGRLDVGRAEDFKSKLPENQKSNYDFFDFSIDKSRECMAKAQLIVSRAGATTMGEIAALSKASILVPYEYATADHQTLNAKYLEKSGGAIVIREENFDRKSLLERIEYILSDSRNAQTIGDKANKVLKSNGLSVICDYIRKEIL